MGRRDVEVSMDIRCPAGIVVTAILLAGCTAASYQKPVGALSDSISAAKTAFSALSEEERKDYVTLQIRGAVEVGNRIAPPRHCHTARSKAGGSASVAPDPVDCRPTIYDVESRSEKPIEVDEAAPKLLKLADALDGYGKGLGQLAAAQDIAALKDAIAKAGAGAQTLATTVGGPGIGVAAGATLDFAEWLVGVYLDNQRFRELRHVVNATDPSIALAATKMAEAAEPMKRTIARKRALDVVDASNNFLQMQNAHADKLATESAGESFVSGALDLQAFIKTDITEALHNMREAHAKLRAALNNPKIDLATVFGEIDTLRAKVTAMRDAFVKLEAKK
jgi:hypothetical protein